MKNSPYLDRPLVPLAVALRSMLAETEAKIAMATPAERERLQQRSTLTSMQRAPAGLNLARSSRSFRQYRPQR